MSDKIIVKGKRREDIFATMGEIAVELSPPSQEEISKLKEGDEVLLRLKVFKPYKTSFDARDSNFDTYNAPNKDIIAILPQPQQSKQTFTEDDFLPENPQQKSCSNCIYYGKGEQHTCANCGIKSEFKPIRPEAKPETCGISVKDDSRTYGCPHCGRPIRKTELASEEEVVEIIKSFELDNCANPEINKYKYRMNLAHALLGRIGKPEAKSEIEELNIPCFVKDYFIRGEHSFIGEALQCLNDHIGMLENKLNELIQAFNSRKN